MTWGKFEKFSKNLLKTSNFLYSERRMLFLSILLATYPYRVYNDNEVINYY